MRVRKKKRLVLLFATGLTLGGLALSMGNTYVAFADSNGPQTITTNNAQKTWVSASDGKLHAQYDGQWVAGNGYHRVNIIKQKGKSGRDSYIFCINFSKESPSNTQMVKKVQSNSAVQWLITDFSKGHDKSFESIDGAGADYDLADYWLYQTAVHLVACPNEKSPYDGNTTGDSVKNFSPAIRDKVYRLVNEAKKHQNESESEIVLNPAKLSFDPSTLNIGSGDFHNNKYEKGFKVPSENMHDVQVHAEDSKNEKYLSGTRKNGSKVDFNNVNADDSLKISVPYNDLTNSSDFSFKVKATGHWNKKAKVAWIYGTNDSKIQDVAKLGIKATTVDMKGSSDMTVHVKPSYGSLTFVKKGSGDNNNKLLPGTEFLLTSDGFMERKTVDNSGRVTFDNLPLGKKYHLKEIKQPNGQYSASYERDIDQLTGDNPQRQVDLGTIINDKTHQPFKITKKNSKGAGIEGAQFVLLRKDYREPVDQISVEDAKKQAFRMVNGELVLGHSDQQPYIATTDKDGNTYFPNVLIPKNEKHDYYAVEIKSPNGYALGTTPIKFPNVGITSPDVVSGEMTDTTQPIPTTGSKYLLIEATVAITITCAVGGYALYESKKNKER
ncbi:cell wall anchor protein [Lactobacillus taiwanensis]|uniref:Cell wall anchor protein n=1 Tax=Lactobacillus taiwanensis TaxID=508451 RepID=A0A256LI32_9LACO|nr:SpaA isopeptide-forming pilin-related protein [Lactobacillus taiwanensis]OYR88952.1 cell wall anchor protein [Lactobacillus taiwanensis]OYR93010.1 cell wall anchor protein [Lactobacillus taiwanensis]OYR93617.1 cell wall anchor protein [Lactobacillus taiwanensis]OYR97157.1 cell wall anchor protein [Lactobacillus taiwanensis]OYR98085.1 cell wall anchor protein [Lactobacillus taiwanensis]